MVFYGNHKLKKVCLMFSFMLVLTKHLCCQKEKSELFLRVSEYSEMLLDGCKLTISGKNKQTEKVLLNLFYQPKFILITPFLFSFVFFTTKMLCWLFKL